MKKVMGSASISTQKKYSEVITNVVSPTSTVDLKLRWPEK